MAPDTTTDRSADFLNGVAWEAYGAMYDSFATHPEVDSTRLAETRALFNTCFRVKPGASLQKVQHEIPWSELLSILPAAEGRDRVVVFHYGLVAPKFHLGLSTRRMDRMPTNGLYPLQRTDLKIYEWGSTGRVDHVEDDWVREHQTGANGRSYFTKVEINRLVEGEDQAHWDDVGVGDVNAYMLPWEKRLALLYDHNSSLFANKEQYLSLVITCTAEWRPEPDDAGRTRHVKHTLTAHLRLREPGSDPNVPKITDLIDGQIHPGQELYFMRGADYGNLCPVRCNHYQE